MRALLILWLLGPAYGSNWQAAMVAQSPRFQLFALMQAHPDGAGPAVAELQKGQGFAHQDGGQVLQSGLSLEPVLRFDNNINGGTPGKTIIIGGLPFDIAPDARARAGLTAGVLARGSLRFSLSPKTVVSANIAATAARGAGFNLSAQAATLCLGQYLGGADWLDLCYGANADNRALGRSSDHFVSLGLTHQFATDFALFQADAKLRQTSTQSHDKLALDMGLMAAHGPWGLIQARFDLGQWVTGQHSRLFGASLSLTRPGLGQDTTLTAAYAREGGSQFFGMARKDETFSIALNRAIGPHLGLGFVLRDRQSTLANYDGPSLGFDVTWRNLRF